MVSSSSNEDPRLANGGNRKIPYANPALWLGPDPGPAVPEWRWDDQWGWWFIPLEVSTPEHWNDPEWVMHRRWQVFKWNKIPEQWR